MKLELEKVKEEIGMRMARVGQSWPPPARGHRPGGSLAVGSAMVEWGRDWRGERRRRKEKGGERECEMVMDVMGV